VLICTILYALLGFLVAPWLAKKNVTNIARDKFGAELALADVRAANARAAILESEPAPGSAR